MRKIILFLIRKRAYKGYLKYNEEGDRVSKPLKYSEFLKLDEWKIIFSFRVYVDKFISKNKKLLEIYESPITFKTVILNKL